MLSARGDGVTAAVGDDDLELSSWLAHQRRSEFDLDGRVRDAELAQSPLDRVAEPGLQCGRVAASDDHESQARPVWSR